MATAAPLAALEDLAYCPVCFEFYTNPQSLACRHVLCENCVQGLMKYEQVECPECRHRSLASEIKKDFNKQSLVEMYKKQQEFEGGTPELLRKSTSVKDVPVCKSCQQPKKVEWTCQECNQTMCNDCNKAHASFPVTKQHQVTSIEEIAKGISKSIDDTIDLLKSQKEKIRTKLKEEADLMQQLLSVKTATIDDIKCHRESLKKCIDDKHDIVINDIEKIIAAEMLKSNKRQKTIDSYSGEIEKRIKILSDLKAPEEIGNLVDKGKVIANDICAGIQNANLEMDDIIVTEVPVVKVIGPGPWDPEQITKILVNKPPEPHRPKREGSLISRTSVSRESISDDNISISPSVNNNDIEDVTKPRNSVVLQKQISTIEENSLVCRNFTKLVVPNSRFKKQVSIKVDSVPWKLSYRAENICCTLSDGIIIFDNEGEIIKTVHLEKIQKVRAIEHDGNDIIAATKDGLHLMDDKGKFIQTIRPGKFSAVTIHRGVMYALEYKKKKVVVFHRDKGSAAAVAHKQWVQTKSVPLHKYTAGCECDTLHVTSEYIYVGSDVSCCIFRYSHTGQSFNSFGYSGVVKVEELYKPRLTGIDSHKNLLICDCYNNHVKVCSTTSNQWRGVSVLGGLVKPTDALAVGPDGNDMWICTLDKDIILYSTLK